MAATRPSPVPSTSSCDVTSSGAWDGPAPGMTALAVGGLTVRPPSAAGDTRVLMAIRDRGIVTT
jgi:hypothetical protein